MNLEEYDLVLPLDHKILEALTPSGTMVADLYELGTTVKEINRSYPLISSGVIAGRMKNLKALGLAKRVKLIGGGSGKTTAWARTPEGDALLAKLEGEKQHGDS